MSAIPETDFIRPSFATVGLTMLVALATGILFGLTPAFHATRVGVAEVLKATGQGTTRRSRLQGRFVIAQIALTQPLLTVFGSLIGADLFERLPSLPNDVSQRVLLLRPDSRTIPGTARDKASAMERLEARLRETPGVVNVGPSERFEVTTKLAPRDSSSAGASRNTVPANIYLIREGYFGLLGAPLLRGTDAAPNDSSASVIISNELARELWGDGDPIGRRFTQTLPQSAVDPSRNTDFVVTGVYDSRYIQKGKTYARIFRPARAWWNDEILIRTNGPAIDLAASVRHAAHEVLPSTPVDLPATLARLEADERKEQRNVQLVGLGSLSLVLLLTSIGLYGVVALAVEQRRREIGVRMALGARARQVVGMFCADGLRLGVISLAIGLPLSFGGIVLLRANAIRGTAEVSSWIIASVIAALVLIVALVATFLPASRASKIDPVLALRSE
jgi:hypothetical protein